MVFYRTAINNRDRGFGKEWGFHRKFKIEDENCMKEHRKEAAEKMQATNLGEAKIIQARSLEETERVQDLTPEKF